MSAIQKDSAVIGIFWMVMSALCFTLMMAFIKIAGITEKQAFPGLLTFDLWEAVFLRSLMMLIVCVVALKAESTRLPLKKLPPKTLEWLCVRGFIGAVSMVCVFYGALHIPLAVNSVFSNSSVFFVGLLAHVFLAERLTKFRILFTAGGFFGVILILSESLLQAKYQQAKTFDYLLSSMAGIFGAVAYFSVRKMRAISPNLVILSLAVGGIALSLVGFVANGFHMPRSNLALCYLILSSVFAIFGQFFMTWSYRSAQAAIVSTGQYTGPLFSALIGTLFFAEALTPSEITGGILVVVFGVLMPIFESFFTKKRPPKGPGGSVASKPDVLT